MMRKQFARAAAFFLCLSMFFPCDADVAAPYSEDEFPLFMKDLRRAEIIALGAMPFVTLNTSLCYSFGKFAASGFDAARFSNPFAQNSSGGYTADEQAGIILTSLGISVGISLTDFIVQKVMRSARKKRRQMQQGKAIKITPISEDQDATQISRPEIDAAQGADSNEGAAGAPRTGRPLEVISGGASKDGR